MVYKVWQRSSFERIWQRGGDWKREWWTYYATLAEARVALLAFPYYAERDGVFYHYRTQGVFNLDTDRCLADAMISQDPPEVDNE